MRSVIFYFSIIGLFLAFSLLLPLFIALLVGEIAIAKRLFFYILAFVFLFSSLMLVVYGRFKKMTRQDNLMLLGFVWFFMPILFCLPFIDIAQFSFTDALFETVSGLTTTGASIVENVGELPQALIFWRSTLQWLGGLLALLTIYAILAPLDIGGISANYGFSVKFLGEARMFNLFIRLSLLYILLTVVAFLGFLFCGVRAFYAACLAMAAVSTGGFLPFDSELNFMLGSGGLFVFACFLSLGATCLFWHLFLFSKNSIKYHLHKESWLVLITLAALTLLFLFFSIMDNLVEFKIWQFLIAAFFNAASIVATFGVESSYGFFSYLPLPMLLFFLLLGGSVFSASGGIKHARLGAMMVQSWNELDRLIYPSHVGNKFFNLEHIQAVWSFFIITILTLAISTMLISPFAGSMESALSAVISVFSTAGPLYEAGWNYGWLGFSQYPIFAKWVFMVLMILGRLEILAILAFFSLAINKLLNG